ncbi:carbohydrate ABC transporter permease [Cellulomonas humilata]|uniref:Multiple sugar transport system permease protein n=1 Tax=Cellulomonas humilata TaxID=144055 RepID=A0ABU0EFY0_9CELL|nr:sugar ABC transporter permease [Cellulomonas humilata]MDQ0374003.1 multiple sugar transport system permease protein [Cellulomonas humilata]
MSQTTTPAEARTVQSAPPPGADSARTRTIGRVKRTLTPYGFLSPTGVLLIILMITPIIMVVSYSLLDRVITNKNPAFVGFDNYVEVLTDPVFFTAVRNTLVFTISSVIVHFAIGLAFALMLNSPLLKDRTKAFFRVLYILPWLFTVAIVAVLWRLLLSPNGVVNYLLGTAGLTDGQTEWLANPSTALAAVTFINIWSGYPFFMISLLAGLQGIPKDLYEAARVDGAGVVAQFRNVTLPQLRPIIISMALLDFIWTTQQFALIWMTTGGGPINSTEVLSTFTYKLAFTEYEFSVASASAVLVLLMSMVLAFFYVRHQKARD